MKLARHNKGQVGLQVMLSVIIMLFVIGLVVMIFVLMGSKMSESDSLYTTTNPTTVSLETLTTVTETGENLAANGLRDVVCTIVTIQNATTDVTIPTTNYTQTNCNIAFTGADDPYEVNNTNWEVNYTYVYSQSGAVEAINESTQALADVTDWFSIIIVLTAMVILILLTVIIITAIKSSGMSGESNGGNSGLGTA